MRGVGHHKDHAGSITLNDAGDRRSIAKSPGGGVSAALLDGNLTVTGFIFSDAIEGLARRVGRD